MSRLSIAQAFQIAVQNHRAGQLQRAETLYRQILAVDPNHAEALHLLGIMAQQVGRSDVAVEMISRAIAVKPAFPDACCNLGNVLLEIGQLDKAVAAYRQAIAFNPRLAEAHSNLGHALCRKGELDASIAACTQALAVNPRLSGAYNNLGNARKDQGQIEQAVVAFREAVALDPGNVEAHNNLVYTLHFHDGYDARMLAEEHARWAQLHAAPLRRFIFPHGNDRSPERRLKIGYVSPDFRNHPVGRFMLPLLACHDHGNFEIFAYAQVAVPDATTQQLRGHADHWRSLQGLSDERAAQLIRDDGIDILVDLSMHMAGSRLLVFARKPAPLQVTYLAYCSTTGLAAIDYRLSDPYLDPPGQDPSIYTEKTFHLPETYWCYQPIVNPPAGPLPALLAGRISFGCLNNFCKVSTEALATWARVLQAVPGSELVLHAHEGSHRQRAAEMLQRSGVDAGRLRFVGRVDVSEYLDLYQSMDIALDPFPYGGGTTTCDALWMGVPVVSLAGKTAVGRGGVSILTNVGLRELVGASPDEYVRIAVGLADDLPRLAGLRAGLRQRMERSPLLDGPRFARQVEAAYRQMWRAWCATGA